MNYLKAIVSYSSDLSSVMFAAMSAPCVYAEIRRRTAGVFFPEPAFAIPPDLALSTPCGGELRLACRTKRRSDISAAACPASSGMFLNFRLLQRGSPW
jgi:hypothetical protein